MYLKFWYGTMSGDWWVRAGRAAFHARNERQEVRIMLVITRREGEEVVIGDPANPRTSAKPKACRQGGKQ